MAAKIGAGQASANPDLQAFIDEPTLEAQAVYLFQFARSQQTAHNDAVDAGGVLINADNQFNVIGTAIGTIGDKDLINATVTQIPLGPGAATSLVWDAALPWGMDNETPLAADGGDNIADATLNALLGITSLGGQLFWILAQMEAQEAAAIAATTLLPADAKVKLSIDYDNLRAGGTTTQEIALTVAPYLP